MKTKIIIAISTIASLFGTGIALAEDYTTTTIPTAMGTLLNDLVQAIVSTAITFLTANLPLIVVIGFTMGMVWYLLGKAKGAIKGR